MKILILKIILIIIIWFIIAIISKRLNTSINIILVIITAVATLLIDMSFDYVGEKIAEPKVEVKVKKKNNEFLIIATTSKPLELLAIDIPILGRIKYIHDNNSLTDAKTSVKRIVGSNVKMSQNTIEFYIENIQPEVKLEYKVLYEPMPKNIFIAGTDRYKISYAWRYGGEQKTTAKWISLETGKQVEKPNILVKSFRIFDRALSPEEVKELYEKSLKKQKIDN